MWLIGSSFLGASLRTRALFANSFHSDEALYSSWARQIAVWRDPLLLGQTVDKPPLFFYLEALFYPILGAEEWTARQPSYIASILLVPLAGLLAWQLTRNQKAAAVASISVAMSPMAIQFSATAFIDAPLTLFTTAMLFFVVRANPQIVSGDRQLRFSRWSGLSFGLAIITKLQALLFLPLGLGLAFVMGKDRRQWRSWLTGLVPFALILIVWELSRNHGQSTWTLQLANFGGIRPIYSWELWPRCLEWLRLWPLVLSTPMMVILLSAPAAYAAVVGTRSFSRFPLLRPPPEYHSDARPLDLGGSAPHLPLRPESAGGVELLLALFLLAYALFHWLIAVPVWDRYLLPVVPLAAVLAGRATAGVIEFATGWAKKGKELRKGPSLDGRSQQTPAGRSLAFMFLILLLQLPWALEAREARFSIGGQSSADHGAAAVAVALRDSPYGTVLYDHWYSWQWRYHLFDTPVFVSWFSDPSGLAQDLTVFGGDGNPRYLVLPKSAAAKPVQRAVAAAGFQLLEVADDEQWFMVLYQIVPPGPAT